MNRDDMLDEIESVRDRIKANENEHEKLINKLFVLENAFLERFRDERLN